MKRFVMNLKNNETGLTLVELLMVTVISTISTAIIIAIFINGLNNYKVINKEVQLRNEGDYILARILNEIFEASPDDVTTIESGKKIEIKQTQLIEVESDGIIKTNETLAAEKIIELKDKNIYINNQKINSDNIDVVWNDPVADSSIFVKCIDNDCNTRLVELTLKLKFSDDNDNFRIEPLVQKSTFGF